MKRRAAALPAGSAALLLCAGCVLPPALAQPAPIGASPVTRSATPPATPPPVAAPAASAAALGVSVEVDAPDPLKRLLERHLDLIRLGSIDRGDVEEAEWSRLIDAAPAQAALLLRTEGFFRPVIRLDRATGRVAGRPEVVSLQVVPGARARVLTLAIDAVGELGAAAAAGDAAAQRSLTAFRAGWELPPGSDFRNPAWTAAKASALARLRGSGYATASWVSTNAEIDRNHDTVQLSLVVDSGPLFRLGSLQIDGLVAHDAATVRHLAAMRAGSAVTETMLLGFQDRLAKSGLFESVDVTLDTDPAQAANARVVARLRETPLQVYTVGLGISTNNGPRASIEHAWRRVFGLAASARNKFEWGQRRQAWDGELSSHAGPRLWRNLVGGAVENLGSDSDTVLSQRLRLGRTQDTPRFERLFFVEAERSRRRDLNDARSSAFALSINVHGTRRRLDSLILPTEGTIVTAQFGLGRSHGTDAVSGAYQRAYGRVTAYWPLGASWYGQSRIELGRVFLPAGRVVPESQRWRAGGDESVRGYGYRSLGPVVGGAVTGGTALLTASTELARPLVETMPTLWGAVFVDIGNAADSFAALDPVLGTGVGIRWRSPVGPLRLDWAWARQTRRSRLHFSVGIAF